MLAAKNHTFGFRRSVFLPSGLSILIFKLKLSVMTRSSASWPQFEMTQRTFRNQGAETGTLGSYGFSRRPGRAGPARPAGRRVPDRHSIGFCTMFALCATPMQSRFYWGCVHIWHMWDPSRIQILFGVCIIFGLCGNPVEIRLCSGFP